MKNKFILIIGMIFIISFVSSASYMVNDPTTCPSEDETVFPGVSCAPDDICGDDSGSPMCLDTSTISVPSSTTSVSNPGLPNPGFGVDCYLVGSSCSNTIYCQRDSICYNVNRLTLCTDWGVASCDTCISGYTFCDGGYEDGNGCEIDIGTTPYPGEDNSVYDSGCNPECSSGFLDCNTNLGSSVDGCEIQIGVTPFGTANAVYSTCTTATCESGWMACEGDTATVDGCNYQIDSSCTTGEGKPGTWQSGCSCEELSQENFITNTLAKGWGDYLLWGEQWNPDGWLMNLTAADGNSIGIDNESCIVFSDGSRQCNGSLSGGSVDSAEGFEITEGANGTANMSVNGSGFFVYLGDLVNRIENIFTKSIDISDNMTLNGTTINDWSEISGDVNLSGYLKNDGDNATGRYNFDGRWTDGGVSIDSGDIFAQRLYVYNVTSLAVNNLNINGSLIPQAGFDDTFDIGSPSLRWSNGYFANDIYIGGESVSNGLDAANYTFTNGLNETGGIVSLGGEITNDIMLDAGTSYGFSVWDGDGGNIYTKILYNRIQFSDEGMARHHILTGQPNQLYLQTTESQYFAGIVYEDDYSDNYDNRSLVDKEYVDTLVNGIGDSLWDESGNNVYLTNSSKNVGIGTASPSQKLDVNGSVNIAEGEGYYYEGNIALRLDRGTDVSYSNVYVGPLSGSGAEKQTAIGYGAGNLASQGRQVAVGYYAGGNNDAQAQVAVGYYAGHANIGDYQTAVGYLSGSENEGGSQTVFGTSSGMQNTGISQVAMGYNAGSLNSGNYQTVLGHFAGQYNGNIHQSAIGYYSGYNNSGDYQTVVGSNSGYNNRGHRMIGIGYGAGRNNTGNDIIALGYRAGKDNVEDNVFIVQQSQVNSNPLIYGNFSSGNISLMSGGDICITGGNCLSNAADSSNFVPYTGATQNVDLGNYNLYSSNFYTSNLLAEVNAVVSIGYNSGNNNFGSSSTMVGALAGSSNNGTALTAIGISTGSQNLGNANTFIGAFAGELNEGHNITSIGYETGGENIANNSIYIGNYIGSNNLINNRLMIDIEDTEIPLIDGRFDTDDLIINGDLNATGDICISGGNCLSNAADSSNFVPYTGATQNVDLGNYNLYSSNFYTDGDNFLTYVGESAGSGNNVATVTAVGEMAGLGNNASRSVIFGATSGMNNEGEGLIAIGVSAGVDNIGRYATNIGRWTGSNNMGDFLISIGYYAGYQNEGHNVTSIGYEVGRNNLANNSIYLGKSVGFQNSVNNRLMIDIEDTETPLIDGRFDTDDLMINGDLNITGNLNVSGNIYLSGCIVIEGNQTLGTCV